MDSGMERRRVDRSTFRGIVDARGTKAYYRDQNSAPDVVRSDTPWSQVRSRLIQPKPATGLKAMDIYDPSMEPYFDGTRIEPTQETSAYNNFRQPEENLVPQYIPHKTRSHYRYFDDYGKEITDEQYRKGIANGSIPMEPVPVPKKTEGMVSPLHISSANSSLSSVPATTVPRMAPAADQDHEMDDHTKQEFHDWITNGRNDDMRKGTAMQILFKKELTTGKEYTEVIIDGSIEFGGWVEFLGDISPKHNPDPKFLNALKSKTYGMGLGGILGPKHMLKDK